LQQIFLDLHELYTEFCSSVTTSPPLKPNGSIDFDGSREGLDPVSVLDLPDFSIDDIPLIMPLEEGIAAHKRKDMSTAWECFNAHADLGNTVAKYWKGYYLWEGYSSQKDRAEASKLFKEAADDGLPDAQLRYAFSLVGNPGSKFDRKVFIEYLTKAADNDNSIAQFNLGDLYVHGKLGVTNNIPLGTKYLKLAALSNLPKAIEILQKMKINIYEDTYVPLIAIFTKIISKINRIYEEAQYNKKICNALMDRVEMADIAIKTLSFRNQNYYNALNRLIDVMREIKDFMKDIFQLQDSTKFLDSLGSIEDRFSNLINKFEIVMKDLNFTMIIDQQASLKHFISIIIFF